MDNLLIITFDQLRGDWLNNKNSPTITRLAESSLVANRCYTSSPHCMPARWSWITGQRPSSINISRNEDKDMSGRERSIIRRIQQKGIKTAIIGKTHWTSHKNPVDLRSKEGIIKNLGFSYVLEIAGPKALRHIECELTDEWKRNDCFDAYKDDMTTRYSKGLNSNAWAVRETPLPNHLYPDIWIKNRAVEYLENMTNNSPWLLWVSFVGPHEPFDTPFPWKGISKTIEQPILEDRKNWIKKLENQCGVKKMYQKWEAQIGDNELHELRLDYNDRVRLLDEQVYDLMMAIKNRGEANNTKILITSDHGEMLGDYGMLYKSTFLEPAIRVPFIYYEPKESRKIDIDRPIGLTELLEITTRKYQKKEAKEDLLRWAKRQKGALVEYENEIAFIMQNKKLVFDRKGNELWGTKIKGMEERYKVNRETTKWQKLREWALKNIFIQGNRS